MDATDEAVRDWVNGVAGRIVSEYVQQNGVDYGMRAQAYREVYKEIDGIVGAIFGCENANEVLGALIALRGHKLLEEERE